LATPALGQSEPQQTVEGAQRFLSILAEEHQLVIVAGGQIPMANYWVDRVEGSGCTTAFTVSPRAYMRAGQPRREAGQPGFKPGEFAKLIQQNGLPAPPFVIDWSRITDTGTSKLPATGLDQFLTVLQVDRPLTLHLIDAAMTPRVMKAVEFLQTACDRTAETGF
jgi:hypothetical protein